MSFRGLAICLLSVCQLYTHNSREAMHVGAIIVTFAKKEKKTKTSVSCKNEVKLFKKLSYIRNTDT